MKKNIFASLSILGLVLAGCSNDEAMLTIEPQTAPSATKTITLTASLPDNTTTRTAFDETETALKVTWAEGDKITLYDETGAATEFTMKEGSLSSDGKSAKFVGEIDAEKSYTAVYPANAGKDAEAWKTFLAASAAQQDMTEGKETKHLSQNVIMASDLAAGTTELSFSSQVAIMKVVATLPDGFTSLTPSSVSIKGAWGEDSYAVTLANATAASAIAAYIVAPAEETVADVTLSAQINFADGSEITYTMPAKSTAIASKLYTVKTSKALNGTMNGHAWVDLGIRKSDYTDIDAGSKADRRIVFATANIGAASPEAYGYYFNWGEQQGWAVLNGRQNGDDELIITSAKQYDKDGTELNSADENIHVSMTGYWPIHYDGVADFQGQTNLVYNGQAYGDAATYNWGGQWKMLNYALIEKFNNKNIPSTFTLGTASLSLAWKTINEEKCLEISNSSSGQSIVMPLCGRIGGNSITRNYGGKVGYYWTSTPSGDDGYYFDISTYNNKTSWGMVENERYPVRPIAELPL